MEEASEEMRSDCAVEVFSIHSQEVLDVGWRACVMMLFALWGSV